MSGLRPIRYSRALLLQAAMTKKQLNAVSPTEAQIALKSISGLNLDNLEDRVEALRHASGPTRSARTESNRVSRKAMVARKMAKDLSAKEQNK